MGSCPFRLFLVPMRPICGQKNGSIAVDHLGEFLHQKSSRSSPHPHQSWNRLRFFQTAVFIRDYNQWKTSRLYISSQTCCLSKSIYVPFHSEIECGFLIILQVYNRSNLIRSIKEQTFGTFFLLTYKKLYKTNRGPILLLI